MKTLVIAPQPFFTPRGTPFSVYYRTLIAAELGCPIDLLTYGEGQDVEIPGVRLIRIPNFRFLGSVKIGPSFLKLFLDIFIAIWTVGLLMRNKYTVVHAHEEAIFLCALLKPIFKYKLIYDMHSSLPEQLTNFEFTTFKPLIQAFKSWEDRCLHVADATITICPSLYNYACEIVDDTQKVFLIENSLFDEVQISSTKAS
ncbi:MAG: glycosyltransferase [Geitlerinemataceae cyanobacterium]